MNSYEFGPFRLEVERNRLLRAGELLPMRRKMFECLLLLVENAGQVVPKEEILSHIWGDQFVDESNLTQLIYQLRILLGDNSRVPSYIITVPGRGYVFSQKVRALPALEPELRPGAESPASPEMPASFAEPEHVTVSWLRYRAWWWIGLPLLGLLGGLSWWMICDPWRPAPLAPRVTLFTALPGLESFPRYSPDGRFITFSSDDSGTGNYDIFIKMVGQGEPVRITRNPESELQAVWSPDGTQLAFLRSGSEARDPYHLIVIPAFGGVEREVGQVHGGLDWSPDGKYFAVCDQAVEDGPSTIFLIASDGSSRRALTAPSPLSGEYDTFPRFSSDGRYLAFIRKLGGLSGDIHLIDLRSGELRQLTRDRQLINYLDWIPGSSEIIFASNRSGNHLLWRIGLDDRRPVPVPTSGGEINHFTIAPNQRDLAFTQRLNDTLIEVVRKDQTCTINSSRIDHSPRFSPDGTQIAFVSNRSGNHEIWIAGGDCLDSRQLTSFRELGVGSPRWSPDGTRLVFDRQVDGQSEIFTIAVDGSGLQRLTSNPTTDFMPAWSADGRTIYFGSNRSVGKHVWQIWSIPAAGGAAVQVTREGGREAIESADGRFLIYTNRGRLWRKDLVSGVERIIPGMEEVGIERYWHLQGDHLYFIPQHDGTRPFLKRLDLRSGQLTPIRSINGILPTWEPGVTVSPGAETIVVSYFSYRLGDILIQEGWR
jgi:Tol biopolymer transport system component/DNA-binding winged helix-turn-helix (wHTH) protein